MSTLVTCKEIFNMKEFFIILWSIFVWLHYLTRAIKLCGNLSWVCNGCNFSMACRMVITSLYVIRIAVEAWASCQIRKIAGAHAPGMPGTFSPSPQVSDPDMHHGTCVTHVPWCMPGSLTSSFLWNRRRGKTFPAFPAHAQPAILRIW